MKVRYYLDKATDNPQVPYDLRSTADRLCRRWRYGDWVVVRRVGGELFHFSFHNGDEHAWCDITDVAAWIEEAREKLRGYIGRYYEEVRPDVLDVRSFRRELYGYAVSLAHAIARKSGWQGHNWRQGLRRNLYSFSLNEVDRVDKNRRTKQTLRKIFTLGIARGNGYANRG